MAQEVGGDHNRRSGPSREPHQQHADRAATDHGDRLVRTQASKVQGVQCDRERLDEGRLRPADTVGQGIEARFGPGHPFAQGAVRPAMAREPDRLAQVGGAGPAVLADTARIGWIHGHVPTGMGARLGDSGELVAKHQRGVENRVPDPAIDHPVAVRSAKADGRDPDKDFAWAGRRDGLFLDPKLAVWMQA